MAPPFHSCHQPEWEWSRSAPPPSGVGLSGTTVPLNMPVRTVSAPGKPLNKLSKERFSCMMTTICWIGVVDETTGALTGRLEFRSEEHTSELQSLRDLV